MRTALATLLLFFAPIAGALPRAAEIIDVAPVWSTHPVRFALLTVNRQNFIAFYGERSNDRSLVVAVRNFGEKTWRFQPLDSRMTWDSHNSLVLAVDQQGQLHLAGNMHASPLVYFRTTRPGDITSFQRVTAMVGRNERRCTYPVFLRGPGNELIFMYRDGGSGNGNQIFNVYDDRTQTWRRLLDKPLTDGEGECNAYIHGPVHGPDGFYHIAWCWRDTPDCSTNHDVCYARSRDLVHWETSSGKELTLPITRRSAEVVDPVPVKGGLINGNTLVGFDAKNRVIITWHKYDKNGNTQVYDARVEDGRWRIRQVSDWNYRWNFSGGGSISFDVRLGPVKPAADGSLTQTFHYPAHSGVFVLNPDTLATIKIQKPTPTLPPDLAKVQSPHPGMQVHWVADAGPSPQPSTRFYLRWETLGPNRDRPIPKPWPAPTMLQLIKVVDE